MKTSESFIIKITDDTFNEIIKEGITVVDFYADWCGPCKAITPVLEKLAKEFSGKIKICKLNVDENQTVASSFSIRSIPTLIAFKNGEKLEMKVGGMPESQIKDWIQSLK